MHDQPQDLGGLDPQLNRHLGEILSVSGFKFHFFVDYDINITRLWSFMFRNALVIQAPNWKFVVVTCGSSSLFLVSELQPANVFYNRHTFLSPTRERKARSRVMLSL